MSPVRLIAVLLIVAGALGLGFGSFSYTRRTHEVQVGPLDLAVHEKQTVNVPVWAGVGAILVGGALLLVRPR